MPEPEVKNSVSNCIDGCFAKQPRLTAVTLHKMESGFYAIFVVAMRIKPHIIVVLVNERRERCDIACCNLAISTDPCRHHRLFDNQVHRIRATGPGIDVRQ